MKMKVQLCFIMHYAVKVRSGVGLQLVSFIIFRGIDLESFGCATLRLYKINCPNSFKVVNVRLGSTNEMEAAWLVSYVLIVKVVSYVFKRVIAYCVQTSEMFRFVWSKTLFEYSYGQLFKREFRENANSNMLESVGPQHDCPADFCVISWQYS